MCASAPKDPKLTRNRFVIAFRGVLVPNFNPGTLQSPHAMYSLIIGLSVVRMRGYLCTAGFQDSPSPAVTGCVTAPEIAGAVPHTNLIPPGLPKPPSSHLNSDLPLMWILLSFNPSHRHVQLCHLLRRVYLNPSLALHPIPRSLLLQAVLCLNSTSVYCSDSPALDDAAAWDDLYVQTFVHPSCPTVEHWPVNRSVFSISHSSPPSRLGRMSLSLYSTTHPPIALTTRSR